MGRTGSRRPAPGAASAGPALPVSAFPLLGLSLAPQAPSPDAVGSALPLRRDLANACRLPPPLRSRYSFPFYLLAQLLALCD